MMLRTNYLLKNYTYKQDLALRNLQSLICYGTKRTAQPIKYICVSFLENTIGKGNKPSPFSRSVISLSYLTLIKLLEYIVCLTLKKKKVALIFSPEDFAMK